MKTKVLLGLLLICNSLFSQVRTKELYQRSIELMLKECKCKGLNFLSYETMGEDLLPQKSQIKIADSVFFSSLKIDTSFKVMKVLPLELVDNYIDVIINDYTFVQNQGDASLIFNNSRHFYFLFDCRSKKYLFIKTFVVSL